MKNVERVNELALDLRKAVISKCLLNDIASCNAKLPTNEELAWRAENIFNMNVCTRNIPMLFSKARELIEHDNVPVCVNTLKKAARLIAHIRPSQPWGIDSNTPMWNCEANKNLIKAIHEEKCYPQISNDSTDISKLITLSSM